MNFKNVCVFVFTLAFYGEVGSKEKDPLYVIKGKVLSSTDFFQIKPEYSQIAAFILNDKNGIKFSYW